MAKQKTYRVYDALCTPSMGSKNFFDLANEESAQKLIKTLQKTSPDKEQWVYAEV